MLQLPLLTNARPLFSPMAITPASAPAPSPAAATNLIGEVCKKSNIDPTLCIATLRSIPGAASAFDDIKALAELVMEAAREESKVLGEMFGEILSNKDDAKNPKFKHSLELCALDYNEAAIFFTTRGLGDVTKSLEIHSALDNSQNCDGELVKITNRGGAGLIDDSISAAVQRWKNLYAVANGVVLYAEDVFKGNPVDDGQGDDDCGPDY
ncbi:unnamed protein product [Linum tenue]|uniref:Pectinesterase inhibitor domain-containing protein n=2 Tax=Linum tenue TaxID=586396 RepID=A0AAV0KAL6_9ROSI|nr:unnamed protein product [Linum tenue]